MNFWRKIVIFTVILAMPISSWATVTMTSHCQTSDNTSHSITAQMDNNESMQVHDQTPSPEANDHSGCGCEDNMNCSISICSSTALLNGNTIDPSNSIYSVF